MNLFFFLKRFGSRAIEKAIAGRLRHVSDEGWKALASECSAGAEACAAESPADLAAALTEVLFNIK